MTDYLRLLLFPVVMAGPRQPGITRPHPQSVRTLRAERREDRGEVTRNIVTSTPASPGVTTQLGNTFYGF